VQSATSIGNGRLTLAPGLPSAHLKAASRLSADPQATISRSARCRSRRDCDFIKCLLSRTGRGGRRRFFHYQCRFGFRVLNLVEGGITYVIANYRIPDLITLIGEVSSRFHVSRTFVALALAALVNPALAQQAAPPFADDAFHQYALVRRQMCRPQRAGQCSRQEQHNRQNIKDPIPTDRSAETRVIDGGGRT